jgi:hypothetical protein
MGTIENKTRRPLSVPLPDGKTLRLGPLASAAISAKATRHPPLKKLVEDGTVEIHEGSTTSAPGRHVGGGAVQTADVRGAGGGIRRTGDR